MHMHRAKRISLANKTKKISLANDLGNARAQQFVGAGGVGISSGEHEWDEPVRTAARLLKR